MSDFQWQENLCCVATYKTLEGDHALDQFEESEIPFSQAHTKKLSELPYYPKSTLNTDIIELIAYGIARNYLKLIVKNYSVRKEKNQTSSDEILVLLAAIFRKKETTIFDLAQKTDELIQFSDEKK